MVKKKKKSSKRKPKNWFKKNSGSLMVVGAILLLVGVIFYFGTTMNFAGLFTIKLDQGDIDNFESTPTGSSYCSLNIPESSACTGDLITSTLTDGKNGFCRIAFQYDGGDWTFYGDVDTDSDGLATFTDSAEFSGFYTFGAYCIDEDGKLCRTNDESITINDCGACTDSDGGDNKDAPGHITFGDDVFYDYCFDDSTVYEYYCTSSDTDWQGHKLNCDSDQVCIDTRSGGVCQDIFNDGLQPGDEVGSWEESHVISNSDTVFEMELTPGDNEVQLCAEIERSSYKVTPMCNALPSQLEDWAEFVFLDSTGVVWDRTDQIFAGQEGGIDTFGNPDVIHVYWDGQTNFKGYMSHYGTCPMNMKMKVTLVVCE